VSPPTQISTVIIAQDEAGRLERCVRSCRPFSDEVLVVDGGSSDGTRELAERLGCRVIVNDWPGYAAQRNIGAQAAAHDWVFSVDPDEAVDDELGRAVADVRRSGTGDRVAYSVRRVNSFLGAWFTERAERKVRLYDRRRAAFTDAVVHEVVDVPVSATETLPGHVWHESHDDLEDATRRLNLYTSLEADAAAGERDMRMWRLFLRPLLRFGHRYLLQRSFRHGWRGLFFALNWSYWELLREMKVYERRRRRRPER
jgi:glycosyltransferase involved in cell wall biosynthesis